MCAFVSKKRSKFTGSIVEWLDFIHVSQCVWIFVSTYENSPSASVVEWVRFDLKHTYSICGFLYLPIGINLYMFNGCKWLGL